MDKRGTRQEPKDDGAEIESEASASVDAITLARSSSQELSVSDHYSETRDDRAMVLELNIKTKCQESPGQVCRIQARHFLIVQWLLVSAQAQTR